MSGSTWTIYAQHIRSRIGNLVEIGAVVRSRGEMAKFRYLQRYAFVLIMRGQGHYEDELGRERSLAAGDWVLVLPQLGHCYRPDARSGWDEIYVMFEGPVFDIWNKQGLLEQGRVLGSLEHPAAWWRDLRERVVESRHNPLKRICAFQELLAVALEGSGDLPEMEGTGGDWFSEACQLLSLPGARVEEVARKLGIGHDLFRRRFRRAAGMPPHRYHRQQLVNVAARMLDSTDLKAAEVARTLGFCDDAYFSRVFKQMTGRSPRQYRSSKYSSP